MRMGMRRAVGAASMIALAACSLVAGVGDYAVLQAPPTIVAPADFAPPDCLELGGACTPDQYVGAGLGIYLFCDSGGWALTNVNPSTLGWTVYTGACTSEVSVDSGSGACELGGNCEPHETCTLLRQGPCKSDVQLQCSEAGVYEVGSFPCSGNVTGCGSGGTCNESCNCEDGSMVCTGDCPDAGLSMP